MFATVHALTGLPSPLHDDWPEALVQALAPEPPVGYLAGRSLSLGEGVLVLFSETPDDDGAPSPMAAGIRVGEAQTFTVLSRDTASEGVPGFVQLTWFDGPRSADWLAGADLAHQRIWPAARDVPGMVGALTLQARDGGRVVLTMAESVEALEEGVRRLLSTSLLPGEDPAHLTGPDRVDVLRLLEVRIPSAVTS